MFDGATYSHELDGARLKSQLIRVKDLMRDGTWRSLGTIVVRVGGTSEAGVSARLRDLRKPKFGGYLIEKKRLIDAAGTWMYRMLLERGTQAKAPEQLTNADMVGALETLRRIHGSLPTDEAHAVLKLGRWLATSIKQ